MPSSIISTIETALENAWGDLESIAEKDAAAAWTAIGNTFTALLPSQWTLLTGWVQTALPDVETGDWAALETAVLNLGGEEAIWLTNLASAVLQAAISVIVASLPAASTTSSASSTSSSS